MVKPAAVSLLTSVAIATLAVPTQAQTTVTKVAQAPMPTEAVHACLVAAARKHGLDYALVRSIAEQESRFNPLAVRAPYAAGNRDGSVDYGLMQINSSWLPTLFLSNVLTAVKAWFLRGLSAEMGISLSIS